MVVALTTSCEDFLNTEPINKIDIEQYYTDEAGLTGALAGVYDPLGSDALYANHLWNSVELCTDEGYYARTAVPVLGTQIMSFDATAVNVSDMWYALYDGINRANDLIEHINLPQMDETKRQQILGEAMFLRGYYYFMLVSRFGDIPLRLKPTTSPNQAALARTSTKDVYAQILSDMTAAENMVGQTKLSYAGRVTKTTVQGILARVYLQMAGYPLNDTSKYAKASEYAKKVIDSGEHSLNVSFKTDSKYNTFNPTIATNTANNAYRQIFINMTEGVYNTNESMWEVELKGNRMDGYTETGRLGNNTGITFAPSSNALLESIGYCYGFEKGTGKLFRSYDATGADLRRDWVLTTYTLPNATGVRTAITNKTAPYGRDVAKWRREYELLTPKNKNHNGTNFPVLRYADVLLMYAEAENQLNGPTAAVQNAVNQVRRRGYGRTDVSAPYALSDAATTTAASSKANFQLFIEDERMRELCFEGLRRSDLIRWNKYVAVMNAVGADMAAAPPPSSPAKPTDLTIISNQQYGGVGGKNVVDKHLLFPIPSLEISSNTALEGKNNQGW